MTIQVICGISLHFAEAAMVSLFSSVGGPMNPNVTTAHKRYLFPNMEVPHTKKGIYLYN